jgi:hypothetical protein
LCEEVILPPIPFTIEECAQGLVLTYYFPLGWKEDDFTDVWHEVEGALDRHPRRDVIAIWTFAENEIFANVRNMLGLVHQTVQNELNSRITFTFIVFPAHAIGRIMVDVMSTIVRRFTNAPFGIVDSVDEAREKLPGKWRETESSQP